MLAPKTFDDPKWRRTAERVKAQFCQATVFVSLYVWSTVPLPNAKILSQAMTYFSRFSYISSRTSRRARDHCPMLVIQPSPLFVHW